MRGFHGVSAKRLNSCLVWHNFVNYVKETEVEKQIILLTFALTTIKAEACNKLPCRPVIPLAA